jgi:hypothetical protein
MGASRVVTGERYPSDVLAGRLQPEPPHAVILTTDTGQDLGCPLGCHAWQARSVDISSAHGTPIWLSMDGDGPPPSRFHAGHATACHLVTMLDARRRTQPT